MKSICLLLWAFPIIYGREEYRARIPNPSGVAGFVALGHDDGANGGGPRNSFGQDFAANSLTWTKAFCEMDSDDDKLTNGQELGDPCCEWTPDNGKALITEGLSHPGLANSTTTNKALTNAECSAGNPMVVSHMLLWITLLLGCTVLH